MAKNRIEVEAKGITFDTVLNTNQYREHRSDLKMGQFSRVISPIIDLVQLIEKTMKNQEASDRVKAAQAMNLATQGYTLKAITFTAQSSKDYEVISSTSLKECGVTLNEL